MRLYVLFTGLVSKDFISGGDQLFLDLAPRLLKEIKVIIVLPEFAKKHWQKIKREGIEFRYLAKNPFDFYHHPLLIFFSYLMRAWQVYFLLRKEKEIDALYSCSDVAYADIWPAFLVAGQRPEVNWVTRIYHVLLPPQKRQGNQLLNFFAFYLQRVSFWLIKKRSLHILALNERLKLELLALGFPKERLGVLGAGVEFETISKFKPTKKYPYQAVALGRIAPVKGIFDMVKIWKIVSQKHPNWKMVWIGGGADNNVKDLKRLIEENKLENSFEMLGYLPKEEVYNILKSTKVFLCPDHENGWGLAISEAMSVGLPVVSYDLAIFGSVYKKGFRAVPLFNTKRFADQVTQVLENEKLRKRLSQEAISQAAKFDLDKVAVDLVGFFK